MTGAIPLRAALAACALLGACAQPTPVIVGQVDPERVLAAPIERQATNCTVRRRAVLPVTQALLPLVPAQINGRPATLVLDTGAESSILNAAAAKRLGVTDRYDFARSMRGIGNAVQTGDARLDSMSLGGAALSYPRVLVGRITLNLGGVEPDGLLGASLLSDFDLDLDFPHNRLVLYDRLECPGLRPPWPGRFVTLQTTRSLSSHPFFPISADGHALTASLDSGAQRTVISAAAAQRAAIGPDTRMPGTAIRARGASGETLPAELHLLRDLRVGSIPIRTPVMVTPLALPHDIDALLGADFLLTHRVWLSYGSRRIFIADE